MVGMICILRTLFASCRADSQQTTVAAPHAHQPAMVGHMFIPHNCCTTKLQGFHTNGETGHNIDHPTNKPLVTNCKGFAAFLSGENRGGGCTCFSKNICTIGIHRPKGTGGLSDNR